MKIILTMEDIHKIILEAYNGVNEVISNNKDTEFTLDVDGDKFYKLKKSDNVGIILDKDVEIVQIKQPTPPTEPKRKIDLTQPPDFDTLVATKPLVDSGTHPPAVKTKAELNEEAVKKGLMTSGSGSARPGRKF